MVPKSVPKHKTFEEYHLTVLDREVLETLTQAMSFRSVVLLAEGMWQPGERKLGADPVGLVQMIVEDLGQKGLLTYRLSAERHSLRLPNEHNDHTAATTSGLALSIRLTPEGWRLMGYPVLHAQVFTKLSTRRFDDPNQGDMTQFRRHRDSAWGGAIEVDSFAEHRVKFPHHVHMYGGESEEELAATRPYTRVTEKLEGEIIAMRTINPTASYAEIAEALQYPVRTVRYVLDELPKLRRVWNEDKADASLKRRIIWALEAMDYNNVADLRRVLGRADTPHDIVHVLHSLHKDGTIDFHEGQGRDHPEKIHLTGRGRSSAEKRRAMQLVSPIREEQAVADAELDATEGVRTVKPSQIENSAEPAGYPELDALLAREQERQSKDSNGYKLLQAAELIRDINPEASARLEAEASEISLPYPSPVEAEYMRYVADHPDGQS